MIVNSKHEKICGIYCIRNLSTDKKYIGKSINIRQRIYHHIGGLRSKDTNRENQYFINAWHKYGKDDFEYFILEIIDINQEGIESITKERELFWMKFYKTTDREFGYNLRMDSSTKMIVHKSTCLKLSEAHKKRFSNQEEKDKVSKFFKEFWANNPDIKKQMSDKVSLNHTKYQIHQYTKDGSELIKIWNRVIDIVNKNPSYKKHNIYSCCSGAKPSIYGYKWIKILNDDIVQTDLKELD